MQVSTTRLFVSTFVFSTVMGLGCLQSTAIPEDRAVQTPAKEETWDVIYLSGQRIGYQRSILETIQLDGITIVKTSSLSKMTIKRFNQSMAISQILTTEETPSGDLRRFRFEVANPPAAPSVTSGKIDGDHLNLTQEVNGQAKTKVLPWHADIKSPVFQDRMLKDNPLKPGETRSFESFIPEYAKSGKATLKGVGFEDVKLLNKTSRRLFKVNSTHPLMPAAIDSYQDDKDDTLKISTNLAGLTLELFRVSKDEALKTIAGTELDLAINTLVKVKPILKEHETKRVVYRITLVEQNPANVIPAGDTQTIKKLDQQTAELTVISIPIPPSAKVGRVGDEFLESSQYLQRDDELVQKHAKRAAGDAADPAEIAWRMEKYVHEKLTKKNFSTAMASAGEVAQTLEGDCTEHAVLLAAMLRAKGIPSRIVVGLVYVPPLFAFGCHMWTEANLNGQWIPLDATIGMRGIGASHIKLADSSLSDNGPVALSAFSPLMTVIGNLKLDIISVE